jgi:hypothetical protein
MNTFGDWFEQQKQQFEEAKAAKVTPTPTYPALDSVPVEKARKKIDQVFDDFLLEAEAWNAEYNPEDEEEDSPFSDFAEEHTETGIPDPPVHAACIPTGVGKTQQGIARIA